MSLEGAQGVPRPSVGEHAGLDPRVLAVESAPAWAPKNVCTGPGGRGPARSRLPCSVAHQDSEDPRNPLRRHVTERAGCHAGAMVRGLFGGGLAAASEE